MGFEPHDWAHWLLAVIYYPPYVDGFTGLLPRYMMWIFADDWKVSDILPSSSVISITARIKGG